MKQVTIKIREIAERGGEFHCSYNTPSQPEVLSDLCGELKVKL
jgi:hypothetical protein